MKKKNEEPKLTVPLNEVLELVRLTSRINTPVVNYKPYEPLGMAIEAVENSQSCASAMEQILYEWTH